MITRSRRRRCLGCTEKEDPLTSFVGCWMLHAPIQYSTDSWYSWRAIPRNHPTCTCTHDTTPYTIHHTPSTTNHHLCSPPPPPPQRQRSKEAQLSATVPLPAPPVIIPKLHPLRSSCSHSRGRRNNSKNGRLAERRATGLQALLLLASQHSGSEKRPDRISRARHSRLPTA